jgi:hypothetical protein
MRCLVSTVSPGFLFIPSFRGLNSSPSQTGAISASLGRPLAMQEEDFDLTDPLDISDEALDEWDRNGKGSPPPTPSTFPTYVSGSKCMINLQRIAGTVLRLLYGMNQENRSAQKTTEAVCKLDSLLNECRLFRELSVVSTWILIACGSFSGLESVPDHLRWNPTEQDPKWLPQSAAICKP